MGVKTRFLIVLLVAGSLAAAVWFGRTSGGVDVNGPSADKKAVGPVISKTGPYPEAVVDKPDYDFGAMAIATTKRHTFVIRNEGDAPLILEKGETTCECTLSELAKNEILPGESVEVELEWAPLERSSRFSEEATILTNDPENPTIELVINGIVDEVLSLNPEGRWNVGEISGDEPKVVKGTIHSRILDDFKILSIESENPLLSATFKKLSKEKLDGIKAKSGYSIEATLAPGIDVGPFEEKLTIRTDVDPDNERPLLLKGIRIGPFQILKLTSGVRWTSDQLRLSLGQFSAAKGKQANLLMFVNPLKDEKFKILDVEVSHSFLKFDVAEDTEFKSKQKQRFRIQVEVPAGKPPVAQTRQNAIRVKVKTNHPKARIIEFSVTFVSI